VLRSREMNHAKGIAQGVWRDEGASVGFRGRVPSIHRAVEDPFSSPNQLAFVSNDRRYEHDATWKGSAYRLGAYSLK
jgi:hypothetical protein